MAFRELWHEYRELIVWHDILVTDADYADKQVDRDDIPYVKLSTQLGAAGIVSNDPDIAQLGGHALPLHFVVSMRDFSRAKSYQLTIYVGGVYAGGISLQGLYALTRGAVTQVGKLPDGVKLALLAVAILAVMHPKSRAVIGDALQVLGEAVKHAWPIIVELATTAEDSRLKADEFWQNAQRYLEDACPVEGGIAESW